MNKRNLTLIIMVCLMPHLAYATEWIDCSGNGYWFSFLVSPGETGIIEHQITHNDPSINSSLWSLENVSLDIEAGLLKATLKSKTTTASDFVISVESSNGVIYAGSKTINAECIWGVGAK